MTQKQIVAYLEQAKKKGRGKRLARVHLKFDEKTGKITGGIIEMDIDKDRKPDRVSFWRRKKASGYAANVSLSSMKKRKAKKKKKKR